MPSFQIVGSTYSIDAEPLTARQLTPAGKPHFRFPALSIQRTIPSSTIKTCSLPIFPRKTLLIAGVTEVTSTSPDLQPICMPISPFPAPPNHRIPRVKSGVAAAALYTKTGSKISTRNQSPDSSSYKLLTIPSPFISFNLRPAPPVILRRWRNATHRPAREFHISKITYVWPLHYSSCICNNGSPMRETSPVSHFINLGSGTTGFMKHRPKLQGA